MDVVEEMSIGERVAFWRQRRGLSQRVLAGLAGISQPYLSQIESGLRTVEKRSTLVTLANALQVSASELAGQVGDPTAEHRAAVAVHIPAIREALIMRDAGERREPVGDIERLLHVGSACDYVSVAALAPGLLAGLTGPELIQAADLTANACSYLGYIDLARDAARLAITAAEETGDPAWIAAAEYIRARFVPQEMARFSVEMVNRAADRVQPYIGEPGARQAYGMLHLLAALRSAVAKRPGDAYGHLTEAAEAAESLGEPREYGLARWCFGPTNVGFWRLAVNAEVGDVSRALADAQTVQPQRLSLPIRQAAWHIDLGYMLAKSGKRDDEAVAAFLRAEAVAPQFFRLRPTVRDTVRLIHKRTRNNAVSKPLRRLAHAVGVQDT